ncbi:MAG TPA: PHP domain-containing protein [Candidatus Nanoarchaeia archaeon]|nr:PHP domain-containing protein [Candidatus Nanoarchaeia archaeon]
MRYDLHIHTYNSACSTLRPETILKAAKRVGLDGIAVGDHNTVKGGQEVKKLNKDKDFEVIPSIEVSTDRGHVLGLYIREEIKSREFFSVTDEIKKQGGIVILAHPFRVLPHLRAKIKGVDLKKCLDGIECFNARTSYFSNRSAVKTADKFNLAKTGGSDSHFSFEIGRSYTVFEGDLRDAVRKRKTQACGSNVTGLMGSSFSFFKKHIFRVW